MTVVRAAKKQLKKDEENLRKNWLRKLEAILVSGILTAGHTRNNRKSSLHGP